MFVVLTISAGAQPTVIKFEPANGATNVDPSLTELKVTFSESMMDGSWSWMMENKGTFPQTAGQPHYASDGKTNVLPVKLKPGKKYVLWVNSKHGHNFKSRSGVPATPARWTFQTKK